MLNEPQDLRQGWLSLARRLQSVAKGRGAGVISFVVWVDDKGDPRFWTSPERKNIEPASQQEQFFTLVLGEDDT